MSDGNKIIGPALPPHLLSKFKSNERPEEEEDGSDSNESKGEASDAVGSGGNECDLYGPALPPHLIKPVVGAQLPSKSSLTASAVTEEEEEDDDDDDDEAFGPLPEGINKDGEISLAHHQLEMRANYLKRKMAEEGSSVKEDKMMRESWMLELPPEKATSLGLGPRSFRMKAAPDMRNRSDWTDTPADRERKKMLGEKCDEKSAEEEMKLAVISERDKVMEEMVEKCKKKDDKRQLSLLEMHQKKLKKKQKKDKKKNKDKKPERRPFDRNIDLQANRFDEAQKKSIFKKAQLLDTRFSQGQSKFL